VDGGTTVAVGSNAEDFTGTTVPAESTAVSISFLLGSLLCDRAVIMNEQRQEAYLNLINTLLNCASDEEINQVLDTNQDLIDPRLVQIIGRVAETLTERGDENATHFLIDVARQLAEALGWASSTLPSSQFPVFNSQLEFLLQVLQLTQKCKGNPKGVYPLLQANLDKLDEDFAQLLQSWATAKFSTVEIEVRNGIAGVIGNFSNLIQSFPLGNRANNLEIAIAGYEVVLTVFTQETLPEYWATVQNNLANAYCHRIAGRREENLEFAISCYKNALQIHTRNTFPIDWAMTQKNLGNAYRNRIRGERYDNLEQAIACYKNALKEYN
jgi:tetratricopeptide (TPR) repeat protein